MIECITSLSFAFNKSIYFFWQSSAFFFFFISKNSNICSLSYFYIQFHSLHPYLSWKERSYKKRTLPWWQGKNFMSCHGYIINLYVSMCIPKKNAQWQFYWFLIAFITASTASFWSGVRYRHASNKSFNSGVHSIISSSAKKLWKRYFEPLTNRF